MYDYKQFSVFLCNPLETHPVDAQHLLLNLDDIEDFLRMIHKSNKTVIIYPPNEVQENENKKYKI